MEDYPFILKALSEGYHIVFNDEYLVEYRVRNDSVSHQDIFTSPIFKSEMKFFFYKKIQYLIKSGMLIELVKEMLYFIKFYMITKWRKNGETK